MFSSGNNVTITKVFLGFVMIFIIVLAPIFYFISLSFFLLTIIPLLMFLVLSAKLFVGIAYYIVDEESITINGSKVLWENVCDVKMYFQSRRIITIEYRKNNKVLTAVLITKIDDKNDSFIPKEFKSSYQTELELFIRDKLSKQTKV